MSNIVHLNAPSHRHVPHQRHAALMRGFASQRRITDDVFWLKENAELLNILECTNAEVGAEGIAVYEDYYAALERRLEFFPQYYRFLMSICLDLEDLGMPGDKGAALVHWVASQGLAQAELSDLQRLEAQRLLARRGGNAGGKDAGLEARVREFMARPLTFAMPNKKAAYELTHAVFYLSEYGRRDPGLGRRAQKSLEFVGMLAFLEQNADLLAEVCIALKFAGMAVPATWQNWVTRHTQAFVVCDGGGAGSQDDYHEYLVCNWMVSVVGQVNFKKPIPQQGARFIRPAHMPGALRELSEFIFDLEGARSDDWDKMRPKVLAALSPEAQAVMASAETSCSSFGEFFAGFARVGLVARKQGVLA